MFGQWSGVSPGIRGGKASQGGRMGQGASSPPAPAQPATTSPLCLCELQRKGDRNRKKKK